MLENDSLIEIGSTKNSSAKNSVDVGRVARSPLPLADLSQSPPLAPGLCTADSLPVGAVARVVHVSARCPELRHKLLSLGVVRGTKVEVVGVAPLRDPMNIRLLGFTLSLRLCEASCITVELV